jgi:hypothetical protein
LWVRPGAYSSVELLKGENTSLLQAFINYRKSFVTLKPALVGPFEFVKIKKFSN